MIGFWNIRRKNDWIWLHFEIFEWYITVFWNIRMKNDSIVSHFRLESTRLITRAAKPMERDQRHVQVWLKSHLDQVVNVFLSLIWPKNSIVMSSCTIRWPTIIRIIDVMSSLEMTNSCWDSKGIQVMIVSHSSTRKQTQLVERSIELP